MKELFIDKATCIGCGVCMNICKRDAIRLKKDANGFLYPQINTQACVDCGACQKHCPVLSIEQLQLTEHHIYNYAGYCKDAGQLAKSASGGAAWAIANAVLEQNGVVYGVRYTNHYRSAITCRVTRPEELATIKDSKYMQSDKGNIYPLVKKDLENGVMVLYTGTPCEIGAVKAYLGKEYENLYTCEIICHGPTSSKIAEHYLDEQERNYKSKVSWMSVRSKINGWKVPHIQVKFENGEQIVQKFYESDYGIGFSTLVRDSCRNCKYKGEHKVADFTVGDFWGADENKAYWNPNGISAINVHTRRGNELLEKIKDLQLFEVTYNDILSGNSFIEKSVPYNRMAALFRWNMDVLGLHNAVKMHRHFQTLKKKVKKN